MHNQRVKAGPSLGGKNARYSVIVAGVSPQSINGFGWEGEQPAFGQDPACGSHSVRGGGQLCRLHNVSPMTQRNL